MSSFTTSLGMLALAALGMAGWQFSQTEHPPLPTIDAPAEVHMALALPGLPALPARLTTEPARAAITLPPELGSNGLPCGLQVYAHAVPPAMVALEINDACAPEQTYQLQHAGIEIAIESNAQGEAALHLPAFSDPARIDVTRVDGASHAVTVDVADLHDYHRISLSWAGPADLSLHAHERGAASGTRGHIHSGAPGTSRAAILGQGGFLAQLGNTTDGARAEVYTFPRDALGDEGLVRFRVALPPFCRQAIAAVRIETRADGSNSHNPVVIAPEACGSQTAQSLLQNVFEDLRIARR